MKKLLPIYVCALFLLSACGFQKEYSQVQRSGSNEERYSFAQVAFDRKEYKKAIDLWEPLVLVYRGRDKAEPMLYHLAFAYYYQKDYFMGSYYFRLLTRQFPNSEYVEEAFYMSAFCKSLESPYFRLDQTATVEAMRDFQLFVNYYPESPRVKNATDLMSSMRQKLGRKAYEIANMYYKRELYNASAIAYKNFIRDYPESIYREDAMFLLVQSRFRYAEQSIHKKQRERYEKMVEAYDTFLRSYENSKHRKELDKQYNKATEKLKQYGS